MKLYNTHRVSAEKWRIASCGKPTRLVSEVVEVGIDQPPRPRTAFLRSTVGGSFLEAICQELLKRFLPSEPATPLLGLHPKTTETEKKVHGTA